MEQSDSLRSSAMGSSDPHDTRPEEPDPHETSADDQGGRDRDVSRAVDQLCDEFQKAWEKGERPEIDGFLSRIGEGERDNLRRELEDLVAGLIRHDYRRALQAGENPQIEDFVEQRAEAGVRDRVRAELRRFSRSPDARRASVDFRRIPEGTRIAEYEIKRTLGEGGMGVVYLARHVHVHKDFAFKVLSNPDHVERFESEMRAIGRLHHPNIAAATDARYVDGVPFLVMEYVDGRDLEKIVRENGPLNQAKACDLFGQAARAIEYAHSEGIIHRDIKPSNLMVDRHERLKIMDWGLAKLNDRSLTRDGVAMGTLDFMPPEQFHGAGDVDKSADLYSLGATLYYALTGTVPFDKRFYDSQAHVTDARFKTGISALASEQIPCADIRELIRKLLHPDPDGRFESAGDVGEFLERKLSESDKPTQVMSPPVTRAGDSQAPTLTRRRFVTYGSAGAASIVLGLAAYQQFFRPARGVDPAHAKLAHDLASMTGLRGEWWFEDLPIFSPPLRREMINRIENGEDIADYQELYDLIQGQDLNECYFQITRHCDRLSRSVPERNRDFVRNYNSVVTGQTESAEFRDGLQNEVLKTIDMENASPEVIHSGANILHYLGQFSAAEAAYERVIDAYRQQSLDSLKCLAVLDLVRLRLATNRAQVVSGLLKEIRDRLPAISLITAKCLEVQSLWNTQFEPAQLLGELDMYGSDDRRPIAVHAKFVRARNAFERGRLDEALQELDGVRSDFEDVRTDSEAVAMHSEQSWRVGYFYQLVWVDQVYEMIKFFKGDLDDSGIARLIQNVERRADGLKKKRQAGGSHSSAVWLEERRLRERLVNLTERRSDVHLMGTAQYQVAYGLYDRACDLAIQRGFNEDLRSRYVVRLEAKRQLADKLMYEGPQYEEPQLQAAFELLRSSGMVSGESTYAPDLYQATLSDVSLRDLSRDQLCVFGICLTLWFRSSIAVGQDADRDTMDNLVRKLLSLGARFPQSKPLLKPCMEAAEQCYGLHEDWQFLPASPRQKLKDELSLLSASTATS